MTLIAMMLLVLAQTPSAPEIPVLRVGDTIESEIVESDPVVRTEALDELSEEPVRAKTFRVEHDGSGPFRIEARSHFFDTYLIVEGLKSGVLEDDDGGIRSHSRIESAAGETRVLVVQVAALHGGVGPFRLVVAEGRSAPLDPHRRSALELADARAAVKAVETALGLEHPTTAASLNDLAWILQSKGSYDESRPLYERALTISETAFGPAHHLTAVSLNNLALLLSDQGAYDEARPLYERALAINESALGPAHPETATNVNNLAILLKSQGVYDEALPLYRRALEIREAVLGPDQPQTAESMSNLAVLLMDLGALDEARPLLERALMTWESLLGPDHPRTAVCLNNLAGLLHVQGAYDEARLVYERALGIVESSLGPRHPFTASILNSLAELLRGQGAYDQARPLLERALEIRESAFGAFHPATTVSVSSLASLLEAQGAYEEARPLFERALANDETTLGPDHPDTARSLSNLALHLHTRGAGAEAGPLLERAVSILKSTLGADHPWTASGMHNLARVLHDRGASAEARPLMERALAIFESALGRDHPSTAVILNSLAGLHHGQGAYDEARSNYERSLEIRESALGPEHPSTAASLSNLAILEVDSGDLASGFSRSRRAFQMISDHHSRIAWSMSESDRLRLLGTWRMWADLVISLAHTLGAADARVAAYEAVLGVKWRVGRELLRDGLRAVRALSKEDRALVAKLRSVQRRLSDAVYATEVGDLEAHAEQLAALRRERDALERDLARRRGGGIEKGTAQRTQLASLEAVIPDDAVAVDFLIHRRYDPAVWDASVLVRTGRWTADRVSAWVVRPGRPLAHFDLGEAAAVEEAVRSMLESVAGRRGVPPPVASADDVRDRVRELLWDPIRESVGDARVVWLSGDGFLGGLPFEVLRDDDGMYLVERHAFCYQGDLAGLAKTLHVDEPAASSLFAVGSVDYWANGEVGLTAAEAVSSGLRAPISRVFPDLRWTDREVSAVVGLHRMAAGRDAEQVVLRGEDATEEAIKAGLSGFTHIHLATHGFFHPEGVPSAWKNLREHDDAGLSLLRESEQRVVGYLPGLLSGLVFAGANAEPEPGRDNGLLTAEEITYLDLTSADLVVLSACETGLGRPEAGEGMIGLRRAFRMAGARTVISSLWEVDDQATRDLMTLFYENLWRRGMPKLEALRQAQLSILEENRKRYDGDGRPATWGAFVLDGAPG